MDSTLLKQAKSLDFDARIDLVEAIWNTVAEESDHLPVPKWHKGILRQRLAEFEADPAPGASWEEVQRRLERLD